MIFQKSADAMRVAHYKHQYIYDEYSVVESSADF